MHPRRVASRDYKNRALSGLGRIALSIFFFLFFYSAVIDAFISRFGTAEYSWTFPFYFYMRERANERERNGEGGKDREAMKRESLCGIRRASFSLMTVSLTNVARPSENLIDELIVIASLSARFVSVAQSNAVDRVSA